MTKILNSLITSSSIITLVHLSIVLSQCVLLFLYLFGVSITDIGLGHIMRSEETDPLYQATFKPTGEFNTFDKKRVGRPRGHWAESTMGMALEKHGNMEFERDNVNHHVYLFCLALDRIV